MISISHTATIASLSMANETLDLDVTRGPISYFRSGRGKPLVCLHATGHGSGDFESLADRMAGEYEIIALDWPGQGLSAFDGVRPDAHHYAEIVCELIARLNLERPILVGNSIGGAAALVAASRRPQDLAGVVLCNPGGLAKIDATAKFFISLMSGFFHAGARDKKWFPTVFRVYYNRLVLPRAPERAREIIATGKHIAPLLHHAWEGFAEPKSDLRALAAELEIPVWLAWAKHDRLVSWGRSKKAARQIPTHSLTLFRGGHAPFLEDQDRFISGFRDFLSTLE